MPDPRTQAIAAVEPDRLLPGENPTTDRPEDIKLWVNTYRELLEYKDMIITTTRQVVNTAIPQAATEIQATDEVILVAERARLQRRFSYWMDRLRELEPRG